MSRIAKNVLKRVYFLLFLLLVTNVNAQPSLKWAKGVGNEFYSGGNIRVLFNKVDGSGNTILTGYYNNTADFDPGAGTAYLTSNGGTDIFIAKYDASGNYVWARSMGGTSNDQGLSLTVDGIGNIYLTGYFRSVVDFDPGAGTANLTSNAANDIFFAKYDASGNYVWSKAMGSTYDDRGNSITIDASGNVYVLGQFEQTVDFDPGIGTANLTSAGTNDVFLAKYDALGNYVWTRGIGGTNSDQGNSMAIDGMGNLYITGLYSETVDFDPGAGIVNLTSLGGNDIFLAKFDGSGTYAWAVGMGGTGTDQGLSVSLDASNNVYFTGSFRSTVDFDPSISVSNLTSAGSADIFVAKFTSAGAHTWSRAMGGSSNDQANVIICDASSNVYVTGYFNGTVDFDAGAGVVNLSSAGGNDIFLTKYDASGNYIWATAMGGSSTDQGLSLTVDAAGKVYLSGFFKGTADFDPGSSSSANLSTLVSLENGFISTYAASTGNYISAKQLGGISGVGGNVFLKSHKIDASGNVFITGEFSSQVDFDPGPGTVTLTSSGNADMFIAKYDASGNYLWAKGIGSSSSNDNGSSLTVDGSGNLYVTGYFQGTVDFDPGAGTAELTNIGWDDIFLAKYDASGNYVWAKVIGGTNTDLAVSVSLDGSGNILLTGTFTGTVDFDPGSATTNLTSGGQSDIFLAKYDASGNFVWAKRLGGTSTDNVSYLTTDGSGNIYITGNYNGTADFDPGAGSANLTTFNGNTDLYLAKYNGSGEYVWAKSIGNSGSDCGVSISLDGSGNIHLTGYFQGTVDFDPGSGTSNLTNVGGFDIFLAKYDNTGNHLWSKQLSGISLEESTSIALDGNGNVYLTGYFSGTVDFDPGSGTTNLTSNGGNDIFFAKYNVSGEYVWASAIGGTSTDCPNTISLDAGGNLYISGYFNQTVDFDPGSGTSNLTSLSGSNYGFVAVYSCTNPTSGGTIAAAQSGSSPFDPAAFTSSTAPTGHDGTLEYKWQSSTTSSSAGFSDIASSNAATYDPGSLTQTTWFKRLARVDCKSNWTGAAESNVLEVTVSSMAAEPTAQPTALYFTTTGSSSYNFVGNFTASGSATGYLVVRNTGTVPTFTPVDGTGYSTGGQTGGEIVYSGALTTFTENAVTNNTTYHYAIYAFNGTGSTTNYLTASPLFGKAVANTTSSGSLTASGTGSSIGFPASGVTVNFPSGTSGTNLTVSKTASAPSSNIQVSSSIRGMKPMYFSITSSNASPGTYTLILDFSSLSLTPTQWNNYKITKRADASSPWVDVTTLGATIVSRQTDGVWGKFTISGLSSFSEFGLAEAYDGILTSNLDQTPETLPFTVSTGDYGGQAFVTDGVRYNLSKVKVSVDANATDLRARLYGSTAGGNVNTTTILTSFNTPTLVSGSVYQLTPVTPVKLEPGTRYWVVFYSANNPVDIDYTTSLTESGPASFPTDLSAASNDAGVSYNLITTDPAIFSVEATEVTRTWTGGSSTVWSASGNWSPSETPGNGEIMTIPNLSNDPVLDANIAPANLIIATGTVLNMADKNITLTQGFSNDGSLTSTTGKLILAGTSAQGIVGTGSISRLEVNNSAGAVISAGSYMQTITGMLTPTSGTLTTNGNLTLKSDATGTARVGAGSASGGYIIGDVITQRHLTKLTGTGRNGRAWRLVSVPVAGTGTLRDYFMGGRSGADLTVSANRSAEPDALGTVVIGHNQPDAATATGAGYDWIGVAGQVSSLRYYTQNSGSGSFASAQVPSLSTSYSAAAQGYMLFSRGDRQQNYQGTSNSSTTKLQAAGTLKQGTQTVTIPALATAGYVLVGNPYMALIDMDQVYNDNSTIIDPIVYVWDANSDGNTYKQGGYRTITRTGPGAWTTTGGGANPQYIESHAAFFVRPTAAGGTLQIKESHKVSGTPGIAPHGTNGNNPARLFVNLEVTDTANRRLVDGGVVFFDTQYKEGLGDAVDIASMSNITAGAMGLKQSGMRLAMEGRPWPADSLQRSIPVDMRNLGDDAYVLRIIGESLTKDGFRAWLRDRHLKTETEVKVDGELLYPFSRTGDAGIDSGRFEIVYRTAPKSMAGTATPDDASEAPSVRLFPNPTKTGDVKLSLRAMPPGAYTVQVLDMMGREVATGAISHQTMNGEYRVLKGRRLSPGQYILKLIDADKQPKETLRMVVE